MAKSPEKMALQNFGALIRERRMTKRMNQGEVAARLHVTSTYVSKLEGGKATMPSEEVLNELAKILDLDSEDLRFALAPAALGRVPETYRHFVRIERFEMEGVAEKHASYRSGRRTEGRFPIVGLASCGPMIEAIENGRLPHGELRTTEPWKEAVEVAKSKKAFVVEAEGDSMAPTILDGDELLVDPAAKLDPNARPQAHIALVLLDGSATVKRWRVVGETILLTPDNPDRARYPEREISKEQFTAKSGIAWRVVLARSSRKL